GVGGVGGVGGGGGVGEGCWVGGGGVGEGWVWGGVGGGVGRGGVWGGGCVFPDFSRAKVRNWWGNNYQGLLEQGVDGIWNDMNEPSLTNFFSEKHGPPIHGNTMSNDVLHRAGENEVTGPDGPPVLHKFFHNA